MQLHVDTQRKRSPERTPLNLKDVINKCEGSLRSPLIKGTFCRLFIYLFLRVNELNKQTVFTVMTEQTN